MKDPGVLSATATIFANSSRVISPSLSTISLVIGIAAYAPPKLTRPIIKKFIMSLSIIFLTSHNIIINYNENVKIVFSVIRPAILSLILVVGLEIIYENLYDLDIKKLAIFIIIIIASLIYKKIFKKKLSSIKIIILSAILGVIIL